MNFKLLKVLTSTVITTLVIGGSLSTIYFMNLKAPSNPDDAFDNGDDNPQKTPEQEAAENAKAKLAENLASSNLNVEDMNLKVSGFYQQAAINLNFKGGIDYKAFMDSNKTNDTSDDVAAKFSGLCNVKYIDESKTENQEILNEKFKVNANGNKRLYIDWNWADNINNEEDNYTRYSLSGTSISNVLDFLPTIGEIANIEQLKGDFVKDTIDEIKNIDIIPLIPIVTNALMSFSSDTDLNQIPEVLEDGTKIYTYNLVVNKSMLTSIGLDQDIKVILKCNQDGLLTAFNLAPLSIKANETTTINVELTTKTSMSLTQSFVDNHEYQGAANDLDCTTNLLTTATSLINEKTFSSNIKLSFNETVDGVQNAQRNITGNVKADLRTAKAINDGAIFDIQLGGEEDQDLYSNFKVRYDNNTTYFDVQNGLVQGKLEDSTINDLITNIVGTFANENQGETNDAMDGLNKVLANEVIYDIMNGNWNAYKKIIKNMTITGEYGQDQTLDLVINAKGLYSKLVDENFSLFLAFSNNKLVSLGIKDLPINKYVTTDDGKEHKNTVSFSLGLVDFVETDVETTYGNLEGYTNFEIVNPLYNSIAKTIKTKQIGLSYNFSYAKANEVNPFIEVEGGINGDVSTMGNLEFNKDSTLDSIIQNVTGTNLGLYSFDMKANVNGIPHNAKMTYQNKELYLDYKGYSEASRTRMSLSMGKFYDIFTLVNGLLNKGTENTPVDPLGSINVDLEGLLNLTNGKIRTITNSTYLDTLKDYITIKNGATKDTVEVEIKSSLFNKNTNGSLKVTLDTLTNGDQLPLLGISGSYETDVEGDLFTFALNFQDYIDPTIDETEIRDFYKSMNGSVDSIINIINGVNSSFNLTGTLDNPRQ